MKKQTQQGFTLIELMIVIAIVGILAALALPAYQQYTVRSKIGEALAYGAEAKTTVSEHYATLATYPADNDEAGIDGDVDTPIVQSVVVTDGVIEITIKGSLADDLTDGDGFVLSPQTIGNNRLEWICTTNGATAALKAKYLPSSCRG